MKGILPPRPGWENKQTYKPGELAAVCRVSPNAPAKWVRAGQVPCVTTLGGHHRYWRPNLSFLPKLGDPQLLSPQDAAFMLQVREETIRRWIKTRKLYGVKLPGGRLVRVWRQDIDAMAAGNPVSHAE